MSTESHAAFYMRQSRAAREAGFFALGVMTILIFLACRVSGKIFLGLSIMCACSCGVFAFMSFRASVLDKHEARRIRETAEQELGI
jgi:hypothetical protein